MNNLTEIIEKIKDEISMDVGERRILDRDVAEVLHITPAMLATSKNRNVILFEQISNFCAKRRIAINNILYGQVSISLKDCN